MPNTCSTTAEPLTTLINAGELAALKRERGGNVYRLATSGDKATVAAISGVTGIAEVLDQPSGLRLVLAANADPAAVLRALLRHVDVTDFRSEVPDL